MATTPAFCHVFTRCHYCQPPWAPLTTHNSVPTHNQSHPHLFSRANDGGGGCGGGSSLASVREERRGETIRGQRHVGTIGTTYPCYLFEEVALLFFLFPGFPCFRSEVIHFLFPPWSALPPFDWEAGLGRLATGSSGAGSTGVLFFKIDLRGAAAHAKITQR